MCGLPEGQMGNSEVGNINIGAGRIMPQNMTKINKLIEEGDFFAIPEFNKAIEEKQVAEQKVLTAKQELEKSKVEAERKVVEAEAEKKANEMKQQSLTDNVIKEKFIEKWNGQLPTVTGGNGIFNINDFLK